MSTQHAEPAPPRTSDAEQSHAVAAAERAGAAALAPTATIEQLTQALQRTQAALAASEERLKLAQEGAEAGVWDWDVLTGALYWSPQLEQLYGQPAGTIRAYADWSRCVLPEDLARVEAERSAALTQRIPFDLEFRITHGDGSLRWLSARGRGVYDAAGNLVRVIGMNQDITQRKQTEATLLDERANMQALLENTGDSVWSVDMDYCLTAANSAFLRNARLTLGRDFGVGDCVLTPDVPPEVLNAWRAHYDRALRGERFSVEIQRHFGAATWKEYSFNPIRNGGEKIVGVTVFGRDITARKQAEAQTRDQLAEITSYYDNAPVGLTVLDVDLRFVRINKLMAEINGLPAADHIGRTVEEVVPDLAAQARNLAASILATGAPVTEIELSGETAARPGVMRYWREGWYPLKRDDQTIIGFSVIAEDVTERRQAEAALKQSQQNLARAQQIGRLGSWEWDLSNQTLFWSDELYRIFGVERDLPLTYAAIEATIHPADRVRNSANVQEALTGAAAVDYEFRIIRPDGAVRHLHQSIEVARNEAGVANKLFGVMQDVTERKAATEALLRSEANLRAMIENTDAIIALRDRAGRLVAFNSSFARLTKLLFGVEAQPGLRTLDLQPEAGRVHWEAALARVYAGANYREDFTWELRGETRHYELSFHPIWQDGAVIGSTEFTRDITERKQEEAARMRLQAQLAQAQKVETIGRLASGIAHDFNNMLAVILMRTELALQSVEPATPLHRNLTAIYTSAQRSAQQVRNLLGFARRQVIDPRVIDLNEAVKSTLPMLHQVIGEEIELVWRPGASVSPVKLDPAQVDQMLANLCINARDAIGGAGEITLETANVTLADAVAADGHTIAPGDYVLLAVSDTSSGLDAEASVHLFDPYFRVTTVGTGLGLATVDGIMQQNGGQIQVINDPGVGKTINLLFPPHRSEVV